MDKTMSIDKAMENIKDGATIMLGGFLAIGAPLRLIDKLAEKNVRDITLITLGGSNPPGDFDLDILFKNKQVKKLIVTHIGTSPYIQEAFTNKTVDIELCPMGSWIERIRCGGYGLGGALTPTGIGTEVEKGKQKLTIDGKDYLLELPLKADFALIKGYRGDRMGNIEYRDVSMNTNVMMATAAKYTIAEVNEIVEIGDIDPALVHTPGVFVDAVVQGNSLEEQDAIFENRWAQFNKLR